MNRIWLVVPEDIDADEPERRVLLAKGWSSGWSVWNPETLAERLETALDGMDLRGAMGQRTSLRIEDENEVRLPKSEPDEPDSTETQLQLSPASSTNP